VSLVVTKNMEENTGKIKSKKMNMMYEIADNPLSSSVYF